MVERLEVEFRGLADRSDDLVEAFVRPNWSAFEGDVGHPHEQLIKRRFVFAEQLFQLPRLRSGFLRLGAERRAVTRRGRLERCADAVPLGAELIDLSPEAAHLAGGKDQ